MRDFEHANYVIYSHLHEIVTGLLNNPSLSKLLDYYEKLRDWSKRDYVILENLPFLEELLKNSEISGSINMLNKWIEENREDIVSFVNGRREEVKFETAYLYARCNTVIHEGLTDIPEMEYFVKNIQRLLKKIVNVSSQFPIERTWDKISQQFKRPFSLNLQ